MPLSRYPIRQIAYAVPDPLEAALAHSAIYGSGPFFHARHVPVHDFVYRGTPGTFDHSTVFGQWGDIMVEFFIQHNDEPSHGHDMFPFGSRQTGMHHIALIVPDLSRAIEEFEGVNCELASTFHVGGESGFDVAMIDTRRINGHMVELYGDIAPIQAAYALARDAAASTQDRTQITEVGF
jgi:hypothetical protein